MKCFKVFFFVGADSQKLLAVCLKDIFCVITLEAIDEVSSFSLGHWFQWLRTLMLFLGCQ